MNDDPTRNSLRGYRLRVGERALELRYAGTDWRETAAERRVGDVDTVRRRVALALSADLAVRAG